MLHTDALANGLSFDEIMLNIMSYSPKTCVQGNPVITTPKVQSVTRAFQILSFLNKSSRPQSVDEIASALQLNSKTVHRFLLTLEDIGAVTRGGRAKFTLGITMADLGQQVMIHRALYAAAMPQLHRLVATFGESAQVAVRVNDEIAAIAHVPGTIQKLRGILVGKTLPLHCTAVGKVLLAGLDDAKFLSLSKVLPLEARTMNTFASRNALRDHIMKVRTDGYAINNQESDIDVRAAAVPIKNRLGRVIAAISVSGHPDRVLNETLFQFITELKQSAAQISEAIYEKPLLKSD